MEKVGGTSGLKRIVKFLSLEILNDEKLHPLYESTLKSPIGLIALEQNQLEFLQETLNRETNKGSNNSHPFYTKNIGETEFNLILAHIQTALSANDIDPDTQSKILVLIKKQRDEQLKGY